MAEEEDSAVYSDAGPEHSVLGKQIGEFRKKFSRQAVNSFMYLCSGMGLVALLLPILLWITGGYQVSISAFYHAGDLPRNVLTGGLCAIGVFLILFRGLSNLENWLLTIGGFAAIVVAMSPGLAKCAPAITPHLVAAIIFFVCLAIVAVFLSKKRIENIVYAHWRRRFTLAYNAAGAAMIGMPAVAAIFYFMAPDRCTTHALFWIESFGIWAFSFYWFVKTLEYRLLLRVRWPPAFFR
jgi:hypothetical protein